MEVRYVSSVLEVEDDEEEERYGQQRNQSQEGVMMLVGESSGYE